MQFFINFHNVRTLIKTWKSAANRKFTELYSSEIFSKQRSRNGYKTKILLHIFDGAKYLTNEHIKNRLKTATCLIKKNTHLNSKQSQNKTNRSNQRK